MQGPNLACNPEQLEYPGRTVTPEAEAEPDIGDAAFYRKFFTYLF